MLCSYIWRKERKNSLQVYIYLIISISDKVNLIGKSHAVKVN